MHNERPLQKEQKGIYLVGKVIKARRWRIGGMTNAASTNSYIASDFKIALFKRTDAHKVFPPVHHLHD